ncbi:hypothetical protein HDU81_006510 [Chytriomyces hyalinus]|nr:hypothetical protein HDU81_006510 [Chytriomyces hyalinus]
MITANNANTTLLGRMRNDTAYADVDLVFEGGAVLTAHAVVLASTSDYFKETLTENWRANALESFEVVGKMGPRSSSRKVTLVLDYLYLGAADIPPSLASSVIVFANEIMVFSLVQKCVDILAKEDNLSVENALAFYFLSDRIHAVESKKSLGLSKMLQNLPLSLESGREENPDCLVQSCQHTDGDISLETNLPEDFQFGVASNLIEPLLPVVELFKISEAQSSLIDPFQVLLPEPLRRVLKFHLKGRTRSGGKRWKAPHPRLLDSVQAVKQQIPIPLSNEGGFPAFALLE